MEKLLDDDYHMSLQEAVTRAQWTQNTNVSKEGFVALQIMTGKCITFPGLDVRDEGVTPSEHVKKMLDAQAAFLEHEYSSKIKQSESKKVASYMDEHYEKGNKVLYQEQDSKDWIVGVIHDYKSNEVVVTTDVGEKRIHPNRIRRFYEEIYEDESS